MSQDNEAIDTCGTSVRDMSAQDVDAVLDEVSASAAEGPARTEDEPTEAPASSAVAGEATEGTGPDEAPLAAGESAGQAEPPAAPEPEAALEQVDQDLADLEKMLADTVAEVDAESSAEPSSRQPEAADEGSGEQAEPETLAEASASPATENVPPAEPEAVTPTPQDPDQRLEPASPEPPQPTDETESPEIPAPPPSRVRMLTAPLARGLAAAAATILIVLDAPFADVSQNTKTILGYVGIATLLVALATWITGSFLLPA